MVLLLAVQDLKQNKQITNEINHCFLDFFLGEFQYFLDFIDSLGNLITAIVKIRTTIPKYWTGWNGSLN